MIKKNIKVSPWIKNIIDKYDYKFDQNKLPILLSRIFVKDLGINSPTTLKQIYLEIEKKVQLSHQTHHQFQLKFYRKN